MKVEPTPLRGCRVLVVEDEAAIRETLIDVLRLEGCQAEGSSDGLDALERLHRTPPIDVIVLDLMMPVMDGWQFRLEQRRDSTVAHIPVVALSADGTPKAAAIDADAYIKKPVPLERLVGTIERIVVARRHRQLDAKLAQTARLTAIGTLAAGVAHEINNPLAYVLLNVTFLAENLDQLLSPQLLAGLPIHERTRLTEARSMLASAADRARLGVERVATIVRGMKVFSRPDDQARGPTDVRGVIESTIPILLREIQRRGRLVEDYDEVPPVCANEASLGQVFLNLLLNAVQSLDEGPANVIRVAVRNRPPLVVVEVHDTGTGIPDDVRPRVFEPFFTTKPVGVGTGLGLSICHGIVRTLRGEITFESRPGLGTMFRVELPAWDPGLTDTPPGSPRSAPST